MNITIFGATGRVGQEFAERALRGGHEVTALVRDEAKLLPYLKASQKFHVVEGNAKDKSAVEAAITESADLVFSALSTDKSDTLSVAVPLMIEVMTQKNVKRFVSIGTAGILQARSEPNLLRFESGESKRKLTRAAEEHAKVFEELQSSALTWTIFCPTYLPDGPADKNVAFELDFLPETGTRITAGNTGWFAYEHMMNSVFFNQRVGLVEPE